MAAVRIYPHGRIDPRLPQMPVVRHSRLDLAEVVDRLRDERRGSLRVDGVLRTDIHALPSRPRLCRIPAMADVPRIDRHLEVGTARIVVRVVDALVHALAPVGGSAYRKVGAGGKADDADASRVYAVLRGIAPQDADCALHVAERRVALVRRTVQQHGGGETKRVEPIRYLGALLVPSELPVPSAG